ncbi:MAG: hypothetical protein J0L97_05210, partial [Alphaproteobacteria bacterium]|nr:hypothetical protein [Alphaproteobacteria bacterium]
VKESQDMMARFMDLWQEQMAATFRDPELLGQSVKLMLSLYEKMPAGSADAPFPTPPFSTNFSNPFSHVSSKPAAAAPADRPAADRRVDDLMARLVACEARIASLEAELAAARREGGGGAAKPSRRRSPKKPDA